MKLLPLSVILIVLVVIAWASGMFGGPSSTVDLPQLSIQSADITAIEVGSGTDRVTAAKDEEGTWLLEYPVAAKADTTTVLRLVRQMGDLELESLVSSNPERFSRFKVDSTGDRLAIEADGRRMEFIVGKTGPDFQSRYVRLSDDDRVMLANGVPSLSAKIDQWRDKVLWSKEAAAITSISISREGVPYELTRTDTGWKLSSESGVLQADSAKVAGLIGRLASVKVDGFFPTLTVDSVLADVTHVLTVTFDDGTSESLLMRKRERDIAAIREGATDVFKFFSHRGTNLTPEISAIQSE